MRNENGKTLTFQMNERECAALVMLIQHATAPVMAKAHDKEAKADLTTAELSVMCAMNQGQRAFVAMAQVAEAFAKTRVEEYGAGKTE